jgi:cytochrome c biogenesis protein CcmG/thiol:disulfide interchange protein DsbE
LPDRSLTVRRARLVGQGVALGLVALLFILLVWALATNEGGGLAQAANRGELPDAPEFTLERLDSEGELGLSTLAGKVVVVNFWASWCFPCKEEAPFLERLWRENRQRGVVVVGLDGRDFRRDARRFVERFGITFPIVFDGPGDTWDDWGITGLPETFVVDGHGRVVAAFAGDVTSADDKRELRAAIRRALQA